MRNDQIKKIELELCAESYRSVKLAEQFGIKRIELCSGLSVGGLTPGYGLTRQCAKSKEVEIHAMIRPREGDFCYSPTEIRMMAKDIKHMKKAGVQGVVFGCLNRGGDIDLLSCEKLVEMATTLDMECTFHRAIDFCNQPLHAVEELAGLGFTRILTSGQQQIAIEGIDLIKKMAEKASGSIQIMAGSGVNGSNALTLARTGIDALHFTSHKVAGHNNPGMGYTQKPDKVKIKQILNALHL